jgi:hypothetical protein
MCVCGNASPYIFGRSVVLLVLVSIPCKVLGGTKLKHAESHTIMENFHFFRKS